MREAGPFCALIPAVECQMSRSLIKTKAQPSKGAIRQQLPFLSLHFKLMATLGTKIASSPRFTTLGPASGVGYENRRFSIVGRIPPYRQLLFVLADICCIFSAAFLAIALRFRQSGPPHSHLLVPAHVGIIVLYAALIILFSHTQKLYSRYQPSSWATEVTAILKSIFLATLLLGGTLFLSGVKSTSRLIVAATGVSAAVTMTSWRQYRRRKLQKAYADGVSCHNVLIIGTDDLSRAVAQHLSLHRELGFVVLGHLRVPASGSAARMVSRDDVDGAKDSLKVLGTADQLKTLCRTHFVDEIIVCDHHRPTVMRVINDASESGVGVLIIPDLYDGLAWGVRMDHLGDFPALAVLSRSTPAVAMTCKRALDVIVSGLGLILLSPVLLVLALIVKLDSRGPVLYSSKRVGKKGRVFSCLKFRTMVVNADALKDQLAHLNERDGILFKIEKDPRITRVGQFLRKHSLDELAQLWNVLRGDMSLVGPRPPLASEVKNYQLDSLRRLDVAPGITGLWQVEARNNPSFDKYIALDIEYVENWSLSLDFSILLRTVSVVLAGTGS
jgi:exopolysaccharide biosynthesis polyprenyl glycosylphosphotransferase